MKIRLLLPPGRSRSGSQFVAPPRRRSSRVVSARPVVLLGHQTELAHELHPVKEQVLRFQLLAMYLIHRCPTKLHGLAGRLNITVGGVEDTVMRARKATFDRCCRSLREEPLDLQPPVGKRFLKDAEEAEYLVATTERSPSRPGTLPAAPTATGSDSGRALGPIRPG